MLSNGGAANLQGKSCGFVIGGEGEPLGSVSGYWQINEPGTCAPSGGEPFGEAIPVDPVTFCCRPR